MNQPADIILQVDGLRVEAVSAGRVVEILKGVSIELRRSEILGLIGESGSGKSTLGLAALGYARTGAHFVGGSVLYRGEDLLIASSEMQRRLRGIKLAYVAQSAASAFNPVRSVLDQCAEVDILRRKSPRADVEGRVVELFEELNLPDPAHIGRRHPYEMSGGQLQRAMTAMAMTPGPDLIVFDEPTTALDVTTQVEVLTAIRAAVRDAGTAAIYISHDLAVVAQMADRIAVMKNGLVVEQGRTADILNRPQTQYAKDLVRTARHEGRTSMAIGAEVLKVEGLGAAYGAAVVLDGVNFAVRAGQTVAIVGESGSGKTTLGRLIAGLLPEAKGRLLWHGHELPTNYRARTKELLRKIQFVYQMPDTALNPRHTVGEILSRVRRFYFGSKSKEAIAKARELLKLVELDPDLVMDRLPGQLSGGQKQRVCIARALAAEPELMICDEVTSALDPLIAEGIVALLLRLQRETGVSYLFITHDMSIVGSIAHDILVMKGGRMVDYGSRAEVIEPPRTTYAASLLMATPKLEIGWLDQFLDARPAPTSVHKLDSRRRGAQ